MKVLVACEESQRVCMAFREREHGVQEPMNLEEPYVPSSVDLDDFAEFQAERHPMFEDFKPDQYDF